MIEEIVTTEDVATEDAMTEVETVAIMTTEVVIVVMIVEVVQEITARKMIVQSKQRLLKIWTRKWITI